MPIVIGQTVINNSIIQPPRLTGLADRARLTGLADRADRLTGGEADRRTLADLGWADWARPPGPAGSRLKVTLLPMMMSALLFLFLPTSVQADTCLLFNPKEFKTLIDPEKFSRLSGYSPTTPYEVIDVWDSPLRVLISISDSEIMAVEAEPPKRMWKTIFPRGISQAVIGESGIYVITSGMTMGGIAGEVERGHFIPGDVIFLNFQGSELWRKRGLMGYEDGYVVISSKGRAWVSVLDGDVYVSNDLDQHYYSFQAWHIDPEQFHLFDDGGMMFGNVGGDTALVTRLDFTGRVLWSRQIRIRKEAYPDTVNPVYRGISVVASPDGKWITALLDVSHLFVEERRRKKDGKVRLMKRHKFLNRELHVFDGSGRSLLGHRQERFLDNTIYMENGRLYGMLIHHDTESVRREVLFSTRLSDGRALWTSEEIDPGRSTRIDFAPDTDLIVLSGHRWYGDSKPSSVRLRRKSDGSLYREYFDSEGLYLFRRYYGSYPGQFYLTKDFKTVYFRKWNDL